MATDAGELLRGLQILLDAYTAAYENYEDNTISNQIRLGHAQTLCRALLQHHFSEDEGYAIRPSRLGSMAKCGLYFMLKDTNGRCPDYKPLKNPDRNPKLTSLRELEYVMMEKNWHMIPPENMTGFEISTKDADGPRDGSSRRPHTYLAIMVDDPKTFPLIAVINDVHRGDILSHVICSTRQIRTGYGILLYGTRLEIYDYDDGGSRLVSENGEGTNITVEPVAKLAQWTDGQDMALDLRDTTMQDVDTMLKEVALKQIRYLDRSGQ
jgi:hypothetical protein